MTVPYVNPARAEAFPDGPSITIGHSIPFLTLLALRGIEETWMDRRVLRPA